MRVFLPAFLLVVTVALLAGATAVDAQVTAVLQGRIVDKESGDGIEALILLRDPARGQEFSIRSSRNGRFYKRGLPPATYDMTVRAVGYTPLQTRLRLGPGGEHRYDFELARRPPPGVAEFAEGYEAMKAGDVPGAIRAFEAAVAAAPDVPEAHVNLALAYLQVKRSEDAVAELRKAAALDPGQPQVLFRLGGAYVEVGDWGRAIGAFEAGLARQPDLRSDEMALEATVTLGAVYLATDDPSRAIALFERVLAATPGAPVALLGLAKAHLSRGDVQQGLELLTEVVTTAPASPEADQAEALFRQLERGDTPGR